MQMPWGNIVPAAVQGAVKKPDRGLRGERGGPDGVGPYKPLGCPHEGVTCSDRSTRWERSPEPLIRQL